MASGLLRIALALIVVVHHLSRLGVGKACVYVFFVLSGYWVARMWNEKYSRLDHPWRTFVTARFLRIWPLFVLLNFVAMAVFAQLGRLVTMPCDAGETLQCAHAWVGNVLILGYAQLDAHALSPAWSLDIELQFYMAAPFVIALLASRWRAAFSALVAVAALAACYWLPETLPQYLPFFVVGILAATGAIRVDRRIAIASGGATAGLLLLLLLTPTGREVILTGAHPGGLAAYNEACNALIAVLAAPFAVYLAGQERQGAGAALGDIAFAIYLVHWIPVSIVNQQWGHLPSLQRAPYAAGALLLTIALAVVVWKLIDQPLERWRRGLTSSRRTPLPLTTMPSELR